MVDPCLGDPSARALYGWLSQRNWPAARDFQFDMFGDLLTEWPWRYFRNDGVAAFLELRERAYQYR